jgi:hypothetical protein
VMAKPKRGSVERWKLKNGSGGWVSTQVPSRHCCSKILVVSAILFFFFAARPIETHNPWEYSSL